MANEQQSSLISIVNSNDARVCNNNFGFYFKKTPSTEKLLEKIKETRESLQKVLGNLDRLEQEALQQQAIEHKDALIEMLKLLPEEERRALMNS